MLLWLIDEIDMIQRKQTLFLLLAALLTLTTLSCQIASVATSGMTTIRVYNLMWIDTAGTSSMSTWPLFTILLLASALTFYTIFLFKRRLHQAKMCLLPMTLVLLWYVALIVISKSLAPDAAEFSLLWPVALPAVSLILLFMARKAILADEKLVRAADRIR